MKKFLSIILAILMVMTTVPFALAADEPMSYVPLEYESHSFVGGFEWIYTFGGSYGDEDYEKLFDDDDETKMCALHGYFEPFFYNCEAFDIVAKTKNDIATQIEGYEIVTANDEPQRDPDDWKFYGSTDGFEWELIDEVTDANITNERNVKEVFKLKTPTKAYKYFKLEITNIKTDYNNTDDHALQFSELRLIEHKHSFTQYNTTVEPTCDNAGVEVAYCDAGCNVTDEKEIPMLGHDIVIDEAVAPTCTQTGLTEGQHCSRCDDMTVVQEVIPVLDHADEDGDGKCDNGGEDIACPDCGRPAHDNTFIQNLICLIIMFINLIKTAF